LLSNLAGTHKDPLLHACECGRFLQGLDLLQSPKDHSEFTLVREWIKQQLTPLCTGLAVEVQKSVLKQATVQHLYGRLAGLLKRGVGDAALLAALHPTPAVCGRPREAALEYLQQREPFDRGFYAGPFGWVTGQGAEFAVVIRSAMLPVTPAAAAAAAAAAPAAEAAGAAAVTTSKLQVRDVKMQRVGPVCCTLQSYGRYVEALTVSQSQQQVISCVLSLCVF
jgi:isochorismate synthase EntC